jgi:hypothetical protein
MGACQNNVRLSNQKYSGESYSTYDKAIFLQKFFMENKITQEEISPFFTSMILEEILLEKKNKVKNRRFFKWYEMALGAYRRILSTQQKEVLLKSFDIARKIALRKQKENEENSTYQEIPNFTQDISVSEQGLRNNFCLNQILFQRRILKSPPAMFRWASWMIMSGVPISRPAIYYTNLLTYDLPEDVEDQIRKDIYRTICKNDNNYEEKINSLYRLLRALANIDREIGYTQGMNFIVDYLLTISNRNEIDVFYLLMSIFSNTFSDKFGMRGFFIKDFPLLHVFTDIFDKKLKEFLPEIHQHLEQLNLPTFSWISFWMQRIYTLLFPKEVLLRIWDYFFVYGKKFLISFGISLVAFFQENIKKIKDIVSFQEFFKLLNPENNASNQIDNITYDIETMLKNAIEKYYTSDEEIEVVLKDKFPDYDKEYAFKYKSIESNPDVKNEYAIYALNSFRVWSYRNKNSTIDESTYRNSSRIKGSEMQKEEKYENNLNKVIKENIDNKIINNNSDIDFENIKENENEDESETDEKDDSFSVDCVEDEIGEEENDVYSHIKEIKLKHIDVKSISVK